MGTDHNSILIIRSALILFDKSLDMAKSAIGMILKELEKRYNLGEYSQIGDKDL